MLDFFIVTKSQSPGLLGLSRGTIWLFLLSWLLLIAPLLSFTYFPSQDGPAHVNSAAVLQHIANGDEFFQHYFRTTPVGTTNWLTEVVYGVLQRIAGPEHTDMTAAILYLIFAIAVIHFCCRFLLQISLDCAILFYPLIFCHMLNMGSYNLCVAYYGFFSVVAICYAYLIHNKTYLLLLLCLALVITYLLHVQAAILALIVVGVLEFLIIARVKEKHITWKTLYLEIIKLSAVCLPVVVLIGSFFIENSVMLVSRPHYVGFIEKLIHILFLSGLSSYSLYGLFISAFLFLALTTLMTLFVRQRLAKRSSDNEDFLLLSAFFMGIVYFIMPDGMGDAFNIEERIMIPWLMIIIMWLALKTNVLIRRKFIAIVFFMFIALQTTDRVYGFNVINKKLAEFNSLNTCIPDGSAFVSLDLDRIAETPLERSIAHPFVVATRFDPYLHFPGTVYAGHEVADITNYEASAARPYFRLKYEPWLNNLMGLFDLDLLARDDLKTSDFPAILDRLSGAKYPIDYMVVSSFYPKSTTSEIGIAVESAIDSRFFLICGSPSNAVRIYHRKIY